MDDPVRRRGPSGADGEEDVPGPAVAVDPENVPVPGRQDVAVRRRARQADRRHAVQGEDAVSRLEDTVGGPGGGDAPDVESAFRRGASSHPSDASVACARRNAA